ncbi:MAG: hypothetical protein HYZ83_04620 [Candidatus Omnitrophica bacterium]|nr:hypothetical protein [Candidatus Omnitrophota bacterium]
MGKIAKKENGKPKLIEFPDDKSIALNIEGDKVKLVEIGLMDMEVGTICTKDISLFDQLVDVLVKCKAIGEARVRANMVKLPEGSVVLPETKPVEDNKVQVRNTFARWDVFEKLAAAFYPEQKPMDCSFNDARVTIQEAYASYANKANPPHSKVKLFMNNLNCQDPLRDPQDRGWIFKDMYLKLASASSATMDIEQLEREFDSYAADVKLHAGPNFYRPVDYPADFDQAAELLNAAETFVGMGQLDDAISTAEQAIANAVNYIDAYYRVAEYQLMKRAYKAALESIERMGAMPLADAILPARLDYFVVFAKLCEKIQDDPAAVQHIAKLQSLVSKYQIPKEQIPVAF